jgi:uncharacterized protein YcbK (DUF882 family)
MLDQQLSTTRRQLLLFGAALTVGALLPRGARAALRSPGPAERGPRELRFLNLHTGESLDAVYFEAGRYLPDALAEVDHVLRDHRTGEVHAIEPRLLDLLHRLSRALDTHAPYHVISGYRSPATNAMLHAASPNVAAKSLHMQGWAIDVRVPGRELAELHRAALALRSGGVGYYPASDFVHVDVGRVRTW